MVRVLVVAVAAALLLVPAAFAAKGRGHHYAVGQKCSMTKKAQAMYRAQHFSCVKGTLAKVK